MFSGREGSNNPLLVPVGKRGKTIVETWVTLWEAFLIWILEDHGEEENSRIN